MEKFNIVGEYFSLYKNLRFGEAFDMLCKFVEEKEQNSLYYGMRLPSWKEDVVIKIQIPDKYSKMTAPYLYVEGRYGRVPWKETMIELFAKNWEIVRIPSDTENKSEDEIKKTIINDINKVYENNNSINDKQSETQHSCNCCCNKSKIKSTYDPSDDKIIGTVSDLYLFDLFF